jgi:hypothetical protein
VLCKHKKRNKPDLEKAWLINGFNFTNDLFMIECKLFSVF